MRLRRVIRALVSIGALFAIALVIGLLKEIPFPQLLLRSTIATLVLVSIFLVGYGIVIRFLPDLWNALHHQLSRKNYRVRQSHPTHQKKRVGQKIDIVIDDSSPSTTAPPSTSQSENLTAQEEASPSPPATHEPVERYINSLATADPQAIAQAIRAMINNSIIIKE